MTGLLDIEGHLAFYRAYHFNHKNVTIHLICIPIILLSAITMLATYGIAGAEYPQVNLGSLLAWSYGIFYILNDWQLGLPTAAIIISYAHYSRHVYDSLDVFSLISAEQYWKYALIAHVVSWLAQFYGHAVFEKRSPALLDNLLQALVLAPFFVSFEIAFWLGFKLPLKKRMDNKAGKNVKEYRENLKKTS